MIQTFKTKIFAMALLLLGASLPAEAASSTSQWKESFKKTIKKNFNLAADGALKLSNKYGQVDVATWSKSEVQIEVTITVNARNESTANRIFDRVTVEFDDAPRKVSAMTKIASQKSSWWNDGEKGDFRVDYKVMLPKAANLDLSNKYGDTAIDQIGGGATIEIKYGNLQLHGVAKDCELYIGYGNASVGNTGSLNAKVNYSKLEVEQAGDAVIESKYSKVYIDEAASMRSNSRYDSYDIGSLQNLEHNGRYDHFEIKKAQRVRTQSSHSSFEIDVLNKEGSFDLDHGHIIIEDLQAGFERVSIEGRNSNAKIYMDDQVSYHLEAKATHGSIQFPGNLKVTVDDKRDHRHEVKAKRGTGGGIIIANLTHGGLKVR